MATGTHILSMKQAERIDEDQALIEAFLAGQESAFTQLVSKYRRQVYAVAYRFCGTHEEADDLCQEAFIKAYQNLNHFRGESAFKTWLFRIVTNLGINHTKSARIAKDSGNLPDENLRQFQAGALDQLVYEERRTHLLGALGQLPPRQKEAIILRTYEDLSCEQVAQIMNCSVGTVKANVFNALKKLKQLMGSGVKS